MTDENKNTDMPLCGCGCGKPVEMARNGSHNAYLLGHNPKRGQSQPANTGRTNRNKGQFQPGRSGNPNGRPVGSRNNVTIAAQNFFDSEAESISRKVIELALAGNVACLKMVTERLCPVKRSSPVRLDGMPVVESVSDGAELTSFVLRAVADGKLSPVDAEIVSRSCERHLRALQVSDLEQRLSDLEVKLKG